MGGGLHIPREITVELENRRMNMTRKYFQFLSEEEMKKIHETSLRILENVGMLIDHQRALEILHDGGAKVDFKSKRVKFAPDLINKCLQRVPRTLIYGGRKPEYDMVLKTGGELCAR
jgi:trimethylamine--corrinoid protein Co-methyltransferase